MKISPGFLPLYRNTGRIQYTAAKSLHIPCPTFQIIPPGFISDLCVLCAIFRKYLMDSILFLPYFSCEGCDYLL
jgi:hypothetical protein